MRADELTQKFRLKGEICPKSDTSKRWRILDAYPTSCYIKEVGGDDFKIIDRSGRKVFTLISINIKCNKMNKLVNRNTEKDS